MDKETHREYMRTYMQKRRAKLKKARGDSDASKPPTIIDQNPVDSEAVKPVKKHRARLEVKSKQTPVDSDAVLPAAPVKQVASEPITPKLVTPIWKKDQAEGSKRKHST